MITLCGHCMKPEKQCTCMVIHKPAPPDATPQLSPEMQALADILKIVFRSFLK